jgi:hypothetical protein
MPTPFSVVIGYHTCSRQVANDIMARRTQLRQGSGNHDWLGSGVYFWVGNYTLARWWISVISAGNPGFQGATLKYEIVLENCLDLSDAKYLRLLQAHEQTINWSGYATRPRNDRAPAGHVIAGEYYRRFLDHAVIDDYCTNIEPSVEMVYGLFQSGRPAYVGAGQYAYNHAQLAVRNNGLARIRPIAIDQP